MCLAQQHHEGGTILIQVLQIKIKIQSPAGNFRALKPMVESDWNQILISKLSSPKLFKMGIKHRGKPTQNITKLSSADVIMGDSSFLLFPVFGEENIY